MNLNIARCTVGAVAVSRRIHRRQATAHGGLQHGKDYCKLRIGPYVAHFTGYQPGDGYERSSVRTSLRRGRRSSFWILSMTC
jgi:hypothetical protein